MARWARHWGQWPPPGPLNPPAPPQGPVGRSTRVINSGQLSTQPAPGLDPSGGGQTGVTPQGGRGGNVEG